MPVSTFIWNLMTLVGFIFKKIEPPPQDLNLMLQRERNINGDLDDGNYELKVETEIQKTRIVELHDATEKTLPELHESFAQLLKMVNKQQEGFVPSALRHEQVIMRLDSQQQKIGRIMRGGGSSRGSQSGEAAMEISAAERRSQAATRTLQVKQDEAASAVWTEHYSGADRRPYWHNSGTGHTTWDRPADGQLQVWKRHER